MTTFLIVVLPALIVLSVFEWRRHRRARKAYEDARARYVDKYGEWDGE